MSVDVELLEAVAARLRHDGPLEIGTMFRRPGIRTAGTIVAFLGADGEVIAKLPVERVQQRFAAGDALPVTMGTRTMREWVSIAAAESPAATIERWVPLVQEALDFVTAQRSS